MNTHQHPHRTTVRRRRIDAGLALAGIGATVAIATVPASQASAASSPISCGTTVTTDVRLDTDLVDCQGSGLIVGAPGITVDLGGHTVDGTGTGVGIDNQASFDDVEIRSGTVTDFTLGVVLFDAAGNRVERVTAAGNAVGFDVHRTVGAELERVVAHSNAGTGISVGFAEATVVRRATVTGNGQGGIVDRSSFGSRYERNFVSGNAFGMEIAQTDRAEVDRNEVSTNNGDGIRIGFWATGVNVDSNSTHGNAGAGLVIEEPGNTVSRHQSSGNGGGDVVLL